MRCARPAVLLVLAVIAACTGSPPPRPAAPAAPPPASPPPSADAPPDDPLRAQLNLDFEQSEGNALKVWGAGISGGPGPSIPGYEMAVDRDAHGGVTSLRFRATGGGTYAAAATSIDATPLRGRRVRLYGWIKTDGVVAPDWAGVWLRVDGSADRVYDDMRGRGLAGSEGWREAMATVDVPADAARLVLGPLLVGGGTAWFDDLRFEVTDIPVAHPIRIGGVVTDPSGAALGGAVVALVAPHGKITAVTTTGQDGRFALTALGGAWGVSAHHPGLAGAFTEPRTFDTDGDDVRLVLGRTRGVAVRGRVVTTEPLPGGTHVTVSPHSSYATDLWAIPIGPDGRFEARLPHGDTFRARVTDPGLIGDTDATRAGDEVAIELAVTRLGPPPAAVTAWIASAAAPLISAEAGHGFADLAPVATMIGKARVIGLGEATHGTREFFQLKHRFVEYLVAEHGFTVFAIEANLPECRAINAYVLHGTGDPRAALDGIYFWTWNNEEVLAMIEWMRAWNADPKHRKKVQFVGFDMQVTKVAHASVVAFLREVVPAEADALIAVLEPFAERDRPVPGAKLGPDEQARAMAQLADLQRRFDRDAVRWAKIAGKDAVADARDDLRVVAQAATMLLAGDGAFDARDRAMADNVDALLRRQPKGTRMVVWAHNGHVAYEHGALHSMGGHLRRIFGKDYVAFGFAFGQGSFLALDWTKGQGDVVREHTLGPAPAWDVSAPFAATGRPIAVVDLRRAPKGIIADWLAAPHPMRDTGAVFSGEEAMSGPQMLSRRFDAVIYVDRTTRARPLTR